MGLIHFLRLHFHIQSRRFQPGHQFLIQRIGKPGYHAFRNHRANIFNGCQLFRALFFCRSRHQRIHIFILQGQKPSSLGSYMPDAKSEQQLVQPLLLAFFNSLQQVVRRFFPHPVQRQQLFFCQIVQIRGVLHQLRVQQLIDHRRSAAFNVHGVPGSKMDQPFPAQSGTVGIGTAAGRFPLFPCHSPTAFRALLRHHKGNRALRPQFFYNRKHFRDNFRRLVDHHRIPDAYIFFQNKIFVVKRRAAYGTAGQFHRFQHRRRGQHAGASHLDHNIFQLRPGLLRRIFIRNGPAGIFSRSAQQALLPHRVHLGHRAVRIVGQIPAAPVMLVNKTQNIFFRMGHAPVFRCGKA